MASTTYNWSDFLGEKLLLDSEKLPTQQVLGSKKYIMLYFSASWYV